MKVLPANRAITCLRATFLGCLLGMVLTPAQAEWRFDAETGFLYESNLSNSDRASDREKDWAWTTDVQAGNGLQLSRDLRLDFAGDLRGALWHEFDSFDKIGLGLSAGLRYRFGLGREAPWILLSERIGYDRFDETQWSNWDESLQLRGGISVSPRIALEAGYTFENLAAAGDFFDRLSNSADARVIFDLTSSLQLALGYSYRNGDVISYAVPPRPDLFSIARVNRGLTTFGTNPLYNAYRFVAETHAFSVQADYALTKFLSFEVDYSYALTFHGWLEYPNHTVEAKLIFVY